MCTDGCMTGRTPPGPATTTEGDGLFSCGGHRDFVTFHWNHASVSGISRTSSSASTTSPICGRITWPCLTTGPTRRTWSACAMPCAGGPGSFRSTVEHLVRLGMNARWWWMPRLPVPRRPWPACLTPVARCTGRASYIAGACAQLHCHVAPGCGVSVLLGGLPLACSRLNPGRAGGREEPGALKAGRRPLYFGHHDRTHGGIFHEEDRPFDPYRDIGKGTVVAVALHDDDAVKWGRSFDIVKVLDVMPATEEGTPLRVQYYVSCTKSLRRGFPPTQSQQFEGNWVLCSRQRYGDGAFGMVDASNAMCACWVDGPGHRPSPIHAGYKLRLLEAIRMFENQEF